MHMTMNEVKKALTSASNTARLNRYRKNRRELEAYYRAKGKKAPGMTMNEFRTMFQLVSNIARQQSSAKKRK